MDQLVGRCPAGGCEIRMDQDKKLSFSCLHPGRADGVFGIHMRNGETVRVARDGQSGVLAPKEE